MKTLNDSAAHKYRRYGLHPIVPPQSLFDQYGDWFFLSQDVRVCSQTPNPKKTRSRVRATRKIVGTRQALVWSGRLL